MFDLKDLHPDHFYSLVGKELPIDATETFLRVEAVELLESPSPRGQPFSITLSAAEGLRGPQGNYRLLHPELGIVELFLVPQPPVNNRAQFEAVLN